MSTTKAYPDFPLMAKQETLFRVGRDRYGRWIAVDHEGSCGGIFLGRREAVRFALSQNGNCREQVVIVDTPLELDLFAGRSGKDVGHLS
jgi:hypothetical protein